VTGGCMKCSNHDLALSHLTSTDGGNMFKERDFAQQIPGFLLKSPWPFP
jgi:hypothetical protein